MGMEGLFLGRIDYADREYRAANQTMEMIWEGSNSLGEESWLFTGILRDHYSAPHDFCFDIRCGDEPIMDDPTLEEYNLDEKIDLFFERVTYYQDAYATSNIMMTFGDDFTYQSAEMWYKNIDKLIK